MTRPYFADDWRALAHEAEEALRRREVLLPRLEEKGSTDKAAQSRAEIRVWRAIAADWAWIIRHERPTLPASDAPVSDPEKLAALTDSLRRSGKAVLQAYDRLPSSIRFFMTEGRNLDELDLIFGVDIAEFLAAHYQRDRFMALLWHQDPTRNRALHHAVRSTIHIRAQLRREAQGRVAA